MKTLCIATRVLLLPVAICLLASTCLGDEIVPAGFDYFVTAPGTTINVPGLGTVSLVGRPIGPGGSDTIVQRMAPLDIVDRPDATGSSPMQMTLLALKSSAPVDIGGSFFDIFVDLDPSKIQTGNLTVTQTILGEGIPEGTFTTFFDVFFDVTVVPAGGGPPLFTIPLEMQLSGTGFWTDDFGGSPFTVGLVTGRDPQGDTFFGHEVVTPEPSTAVLMTTALLGFASRVSTRLRRSKW